MPKDHTRRLNLLVLTSTFPRWKGDAEPPFVFELCRRLTTDFDIHVLAPHAPGAESTEVMDGVTVQRFRYFFSSRQTLAYQGGILSNLKARRSRYCLVPFFVFAQLLATVRLLKSRRFHCIHAHWMIPQGLIASAATWSLAPAPPILTTSHGGDLYGLSGNMIGKLKRAVISRSAAVTVVSRSMATAIDRLQDSGANIRVIPMGVDLQNRFTPTPRGDGHEKLLYVGRLVEKKGVRYLIDALPTIAAAHPKVSLVVAGDGPDKKKLQRRAAEINMEEKVTFAGAVNNASLPGLYREASIVVFPSVVASGGDREGFGLVLVEALGCGCAAVVTDLPAMRDIVTHEKTGLVVPQKSPERIAESVIRLLGDSQLRAELGRAGRRYVTSRFDWSVVSGRYRDLIYSISQR